MVYLILKTTYMMKFCLFGQKSCTQLKVAIFCCWCRTNLQVHFFWFKISRYHFILPSFIAMFNGASEPSITKSISWVDKCKKFTTENYKVIDCCSCKHLISSKEGNLQNCFHDNCLEGNNQVFLASGSK